MPAQPEADAVPLALPMGLHYCATQLDAAWTKRGLAPLPSMPTPRMTLFFRCIRLHLLLHMTDVVEPASSSTHLIALVLDTINALLTNLLDDEPQGVEHELWASECWNLLATHGSREPVSKLLLQCLSALAGMPKTGGNADATERARIEVVLFGSRDIGPALARAIVDPAAVLGGGGGGGRDDSGQSVYDKTVSTTTSCEFKATPLGPPPTQRSVSAIVDSAMQCVAHARGAPGVGGAMIPGLDSRLCARGTCPIRSLLECHPGAASLMLLRAVVQIDCKYGTLAAAGHVAVAHAKQTLVARLARAHPRRFERADIVAALFAHLTLPRLAALVHVLEPLDSAAMQCLDVDVHLANALGTYLAAESNPSHADLNTKKKRKRAATTPNDITPAKRRGTALAVEQLIRRICHPLSMDFERDRESAMSTSPL